MVVCGESSELSCRYRNTPKEPPSAVLSQSAYDAWSSLAEREVATL
jgi:hypothetical protein